MGIFDESYSSVDLAKILGIHRVTVTNWIKKGALNAARTGTKKLVVAVDDDETILDLLENFFSTSDMPYLYRLKTFNNPLDASFFIVDSKPALVLLDLFMPQLNGFNLAEKIKEASPDTRIIVITGYPNEENISRLKQYAVDAVMAKPFELTELKNKIEKTLMTKV
jgi:excisionase family DNA binding protein